MTAPAEVFPGQETDGPGAGFWAKVGVRLESAAAAAQRHYDRQEKLILSLHMVQLTGQPISRAGEVIDNPDLLGPRPGWFWDVRRITLSAPAKPDGDPDWEGRVLMFVGEASPVNLVEEWRPRSYGTRRWSRAELLLRPHERLVFAASDDFHAPTPLVIGGQATQAADDCLPAYLV
ncbi:MAG: hypothetical protein LBQ06_00215 [Frankiaceae bacterium]|nr:hypothetical protein [Frankiaceae bacterium]